MPRTITLTPMRHLLIEKDARHEIDTRASRACLKSEMQKRTTWKRINSRINVLWRVISERCELNYRIDVGRYQVAFRAGRRCKSFQRAERQSKHWLQMEGRVTIFPLSLFSRRGPPSFPPPLSLSLISRCSPCCFISFAFAGRPSSLRLSGGTCNHVFRIRGWHTSTILFFQRTRERAMRTSGKRSWRQFHFLLLPARVGDSFICYRISRTLYAWHGSILIYAGETELSIYPSTVFPVNVRKRHSHELFTQFPEFVLTN